MFQEMRKYSYLQYACAAGDLLRQDDSSIERARRGDGPCEPGLAAETTKREQVVQTKALWEQSFALVDLNRKFPTLGSGEDEDPFQDRERVPKSIKTDFSRYDFYIACEPNRCFIRRVAVGYP